MDVISRILQIKRKESRNNNRINELKRFFGFSHLNDLLTKITLFLSVMISPVLIYTCIIDFAKFRVPDIAIQKELLIIFSNSDFLILLSSTAFALTVLTLSLNDFVKRKKRKKRVDMWYSGFKELQVKLKKERKYLIENISIKDLNYTDEDLESFKEDSEKLNLIKTLIKEKQKSNAQIEYIKKEMIILREEENYQKLETN